MKKRLESQIALQQLGDEQALERIYGEGLSVFAQLRTKLDELVWAAMEHRSARSGYVQCSLGRGQRIRFPLEARYMRKSGKAQSNGRMPVLILVGREGPKAQTCEMAVAAKLLVEQTRNDAERAARIVTALERARRQLFALAEESSRWL